MVQNLHDLDIEPQKTVVSRRRLAKARRLSHSQSKHADPRQNVERAAVLVEDAGAGTSLVQELRSRVSGIVAVKPEGDKGKPHGSRLRKV